MLYFDNAATSFPKPETVAAATNEAFLYAGNPGRGAHPMALWSLRTLHHTRELIAELFNASLMEVAFSANATMALNEAIHQIKGEIITTAMEHNSVLRPCYGRGNYRMVKADGGELKTEDILHTIGSCTKAVVMTHVSNLTGEIYDIRTIGRYCRKNNILFIVDAAQSAGVVPIDMQDMCIDMLAFSGHKGLMGPTGTGGLVVGKRVSLKPFIYGGTGSKSHDLSQPQEMPDVLESGTQNVHGIAGLAAGIEFVLSVGVRKILKHEQRLAGQFIEGISRIPGIKIYRKDCHRVGTVAINFEGVSAADVCDWLAERNVCVRGGIHCAPLAHDALGTGKSGAIRFSFGYFNTAEEIEQGVKLVLHQQNL